MKRYIYPILILFVALFVACSQGGRKYKVGVSQCSEDIWREKQNAELRMGTYFHDNVELCFAAAYDSDQRQIQQIDSLVETGIDLLIVAPNQVATITPAIDRAFDRGIPVIVFERKTNSQKYTAYMGADNYEMGRVMGQYIASCLKGKGRVIEIKGLKGSSPAIERHNGFMDAMGQFPGITVVDTLQGDWTEESAFEAMSQFRKNNKDASVDFVFGQNDRMAMGARRALLQNGIDRARLPLFCGIDGLPGAEGGIQLVRDSLLEASYIYPTHGDQLLQLAVDILEGNPYEKEIHLMSALVTRDNANVLYMQDEELARQSDRLDQLNLKATDYMNRLSNQRVINLLAVGFILLLLALVAGFSFYRRQKARLNRERRLMERAQLDFYTQISHELRTPLTLIEGPLEQLAQTDDIRRAAPATAGLFDIVQRNTHQLTNLVNKLLNAQTMKPGDDLSAQQIDAITASQPVPSASQLESTSVSSDAAKPSLLIVDDNADIRAYLRTILQNRYDLMEAADGQQGLDVARREVPDLIVSDVMMPVMNGLQFCQHIKSDFITSHIPVILLTARAMDNHQIEGFESGADAYITKPFSAELLLARIDNLLKSRRQLKNLWGAETPATQPAAPTDNLSKPEPAPEPNGGNIDDTFIERFKNVVEQNLADSDLSVEVIGQQLGLSRVQLYRKVKALTGTTPVDWLRKARLAKAKQILLASDLTVSEIAYKVGFTSPSYFTKCFKDEYGVVPGDMRKS